jgi:hypothetical protein
MTKTSPAAWTVAEVEADRSWIYPLSESEGRRADRRRPRGGEEGRAGRQADPRLEARTTLRSRRHCRPWRTAFREVRDGRAMALVKNLPREGVTPMEFRLMTLGDRPALRRRAARRTGPATTSPRSRMQAWTYRSPTGRGYNSKAELDFHVDGSDVVLLSCYNQAPVGGMSMCSSAATAFDVVKAERPDYAEALTTDYTFSPQRRAVRGRGAVVLRARLHDARGPRVLQMEPQPHPERAEDRGRAAAHRPAARGNGVFRHGAAPAGKHVLHASGAGRSPDPVQPDHAAFAHPASRITPRTGRSARSIVCGWRAPDSRRLPDSWAVFYGTSEAGTVRGGMKGHQYDDVRRNFDARQAQAMGMKAA